MAPGIAAVAGGTRPGSDSLFNGILAPAKEFQYQNKTYALWAAQDKVGVKAFVAEKTTTGYKIVTELTAKSFTGTDPVQHIGTFLTAARTLHTASKTKPQAPANPNALPDLRTKQAAVAAAETVVMQDILANACLALNAGCFAAGTKLWAPDGYRAVESIKAGEMVYSRSEYDPAGPIEAKVVEEVFERFAGILHLHAGGQVIRTTSEHPFYVHDRGWLAVKDLHPGDWILSASGDWIAVEEVYDTGDWVLVYNLRVADWHTYFVGDADWGWSAWAHNAYSFVQTVTANAVTVGRVFRFTEPGYSADWFVPSKTAFLTSGQNPNKVVKDGVAKDVQLGLGNQVQAAVAQFAADWDQLAWNHADKATRGQRNAIEQALNGPGTNTINGIYQQVGMPTVSYQAFMSPGGSLPLIPATMPPGLAMSAAAYATLKTEHGQLLQIANSQRAAAKGRYVHDVELFAWAPAHGFQYNNPGIDLVHTATGLKFEVMKEGTWDQHNGTTFQATFWRAITY